jgi:putative ABC transport system substrate-binding protein
VKRRAFIACLGGAASAWPLAARAEQPSRIWRVGYLSPSPLTDFTRALLEAFRLRLQELGYVEGRNLILDMRRADGNIARLPGLAAELVSLRPDVIVAVTGYAVAAARTATSAIPIVMMSVTDPVGSGFVKSLAKPGGNITGPSSTAGDFLTGKWLELLLLVVPGAKRIAVLRTHNPSHAAQVEEIQAAAQTSRLSIAPVTAIAPLDFEDAFEKFGTEKCDGLIVLQDPNVARYRTIVDLAAKTRLPAIYPLSVFVRMGGLLSYSLDFVESFRSGAVYVDKILKGAAPAELPVEQPTKFELSVNLRTAKALGVTIPESILVRADEIIE